MQKEPTIHQLEKLIEAFRASGGTDAELSMVAKEISQEFSPEKLRPLSEVFSKTDHPSIADIKNFRNDGKPPFRSAIKTFWHKRYVKYPIIFITSFVILFSVLNLPLIIEIFKPTEYETVKEVIRQTEKSAPLEPGEVIPAAPTVKVPKIGVTAPLVFVESIKEAEIHEGLRKGLVHYYGTAKPGEVGNSFITGHSSNYWWDKGSYNYVFANLNKLKLGDQAVIYFEGNKYLYQVKNILVVEPTDTSVLEQTDTPTMTLMTCTPPGTSWKRLIVKFDQVSPKYMAPTIVERQQPVVKSLPNSDSNNFLDFLKKLFNF